MVGLDPERFARAAAGDAAVLVALEETLLAQSKKRSDTQVASMGQDMAKGRRTEIEFMNGFVVHTARSIGREAPLNQALTELVLKVERGQQKADPRNIAQLPS